MLNTAKDFKKIYSKNNKLLASPYDKRDYNFGDEVPVSAFRIPDNYSTPTAPHIFDQGQSSECAACSCTGIRYMQEQDQSKITTPFSPSFTYANRPEGEDFEGMYIRTVCKQARLGTVPYDVFPGFYSYNECKRQFNANKDKWMDMAKPFAISSFYQCDSRIAMQQAIMMYKGILAGVYVYRSLYFPDKDGVINYNKNLDTKNYGGHCIILAGWKTDVSTGKLYWRLINSWGTDYGKNGIVWLPEDYPFLENPFAIVDNEPGLAWKDYKDKYNL